MIIKGAYKKFDNGLYQRYDKIAKEIVIHHVNNTQGYGDGVSAIENPDRYGPDVIMQHQGTPVRYIEVEVKNWWPNTDEFPFPTVNILERKKKFFALGAELWMLNILMNRAMIITPEDIKYKRLVEVPNKYKPEGELFYQVPVEGLQVIHLETLF